MYRDKFFVNGFMMEKSGDTEKERNNSFLKVNYPKTLNECNAMSNLIRSSNPIQQFISADDLLPLMRQVFEEVLEAHSKKDADERFISIAEACEKIGVTRPTLTALEKDGVLTRHYFGKIPRYKHSEVMNAAKSYTRYKR